MAREPGSQATHHPNREQLEELFGTDQFAGALGVELVDWGGGWARVTWTPRDGQLNFGGTVHGGAILAAADAALAVASNSWGRKAVALSIDSHFHRAAEPGTEITAEAWERACRRRTSSYLIEVRTSDRRVASLHAMVYRLGEWHLGTDAWPDDWRAAH